MIDRLALKLARFSDRYRWAILAVSLVLTIAGGIVASRLQIYGDFSYLLPPGSASVRQLRDLEKRIASLGTVMLIVESDDPARRAQAAQELEDRLVAMTHETDLIATVSSDDAEARRFVWDNRFLFAPLADLQQAHDALADELRRAKLKSNPLYVNLAETGDESDARDKADDDQTNALKARLKEAEAKKNKPGGFVSADQKMQLVIVRTTFSSSETAKTKRLIAEISKTGKKIEAQIPGATVSAVGDIYNALAEQEALLQGMLLAVALTVIVVALGLLLYYRSFRAVTALLWSLTVGTVLAFAFAKVAIGYLNIATAFLSSIIIGNGINFGIVLLARHLEERRGGKRGVEALAAAIAGTATGTIAAALTAAVAYASLIVTDFRGFQHFGIIGGAGILFCWLTAYLVMPAYLAVLDRWKSFNPKKEPSLGRLLGKLLPKNLRLVMTITLVATGCAGIIAVRYLASDPWETNFRNLRSDSAELSRMRDLLQRVNVAFGNDISGGFVIAVKHRADTARVVARLHAADAARTPETVLFQNIKSLDDMLPADQAAKLVLLKQLRDMIDHESGNLTDAEQADARALRPPDDLRALGDADVPAELAWRFTEKDGTRGTLILADASDNYDTWQTKPLTYFTKEVRKLDLGPDVDLGGSMFVFADVMKAMAGDGPKATACSIIGAVLVVALLVGLRRHGLITLLCMVSGTLFMLTGAWLFKVRVNFLDFVALPITIGIGIDYSVNIAARERQDGVGTARHALVTAGSAVAVCSFTTVVGYGSLLLSASGGIRSFGTAAILGEVTCLLTALLLAPALLDVLGRRAGAR